MTAAKPTKSLGFWMATALVVGNMIGSGVFLLPATLAPFGWNSVLGWLVTIAGGLCLAYSFSSLAKSMPKAGGPYAFTRAAFGPAPAFLVAWSYWISVWVGNAAVATGTVSYLSVFFPVIAKTPGLPAIICVAAVWILTAVNCRGAFLAGGVQLTTTLLKLVPLAAVMIIAIVLVFTGGHAAHAAPLRAADIKIPAITASATLTLWALLGLECATIPAEKVKDPERTIPRATMFGTALAGFFYLVTCSAVVLLLPADEVAKSAAPFSDFVSRFLDPRAGVVLAIFVAISGFGALNGWILVQGEVPYAMARDGVFPSFLAKTSARGTPVRAHVVSSALLTVVVLLNYAKSMTALFTFVLLLSTTSSLFMYLICSLAAMVLKQRGFAPAPALVGVGLAAAVYSFCAIYGAGLEAVLWGLALLAAGVPVYLFMRRGNARADESAPPAP